MRVACPSCAAAYEVPDALLTPDRIVRCARCGENWKPMAPAAGQRDDRHEPAGPPATIQSAPVRASSTAATSFSNDGSEAMTAPPSRGARPVSAMERLAALAPHRHDPGIALTAAWAASIVLLILVLAAALVWRDEIAHVMPAAGRLYAWVGVPAASTVLSETLRATGGHAAPGPAQNEANPEQN
jgi:predicted Zn finger-like uncharacterized protein